MADFWGMIWDQDVRVLVMLTNLCEGGRIKAHSYWPDLHRAKQYGEIYVNFESEQEYGSIVKRSFTISKYNDFSGLRVNGSLKHSDEQRNIIQYHYMGWPDHGAPVESETILNLMDDMDHEINKREYLKKPYLVHCSAGIGRTGTFVLIHSYIQYFKKLELSQLPDKFSLKPVLTRMRNQRDGFVQRLSQYMFCYTTLERYFTRELHVIISDVKELPTSLDSSDGQQPLRKKNSKERRKLYAKRRISSSSTIDTSGFNNLIREVSDEEMEKNYTKKLKKST